MDLSSFHYFQVTYLQTQLSLSKLALLASGFDGSENGNEDMIELDRELKIIEYQQKIPDSVLVVGQQCTMYISVLACSGTGLGNGYGDHATTPSCRHRGGVSAYTQ